jgi:hypothetical protein
VNPWPAVNPAASSIRQKKKAKRSLARYAEVPMAEGELDFEQRRRRFGQVSMALSLLGLFVFALGVLIVALTGTFYPWYFGGFIATVALEAAGVWFGFASRDTIAGKLGLWIAFVFALTVILAFFCLISALLSSGMTGRWG